MPHYRKREETARLIWDHLDQHGPSDRWTIMHHADLTPSQFGYGMGYLKDVLQTDEGQPLIWMSSRGVYELTDNEGDWKEYLLAFTLRRIYTQLVRAENNAVAGGMKFGTRKKSIRVAIAGIGAARQMIEALV